MAAQHDMPVRFDGDVIVVTGAGGGLGRAYALELARRGARIVVNDLGGAPDGSGADQSAAEKVVDEIRAGGGDAVADGNSVADYATGEAIVATALDRFGRIDAVIANAGILRDRSFAKLETRDLNALIDVHLHGAISVLRPAFLAMRDAGRGGRLVATTSASGLFGNFGQSAYSAVKMALVGLTRTLAIEGRKSGIVVNAVAPVAGTRLTGEVADGMADPMSPARVAPLVAALAHRDCPASGEVFLATGGWFARAFIGLGDGWTSGAEPPTVETITANWEAIRAVSGWSEPTDANSIGALMEAKLPMGPMS